MSFVELPERKSSTVELNEETSKVRYPSDEPLNDIGEIKDILNNIAETLTPVVDSLNHMCEVMSDSITALQRRLGPLPDDEHQQCHCCTRVLPLADFSVVRSPYTNRPLYTANICRGCMDNANYVRECYSKGIKPLEDQRLMYMMVLFDNYEQNGGRVDFTAYHVREMLEQWRSEMQCSLAQYECEDNYIRLHDDSETNIDDVLYADQVYQDQSIL